MRNLQKDASIFFQTTICHVSKEGLTWETNKCKDVRKKMLKILSVLLAVFKNFPFELILHSHIG
jgi:hypothetical protein